MLYKARSSSNRQKKSLLFDKKSFLVVFVIKVYTSKKINTKNFSTFTSNCMSLTNSMLPLEHQIVHIEYQIGELVPESLSIACYSTPQKNTSCC